MKSVAALVVALLTLPSIYADDKFDVEKIVGTWQYVEGIKNGDKADSDRLKEQTIVITKETFTLKGEATFVMKYVIDGSKSPATIKFTITESPFGAGMTADGIIEIKDGVLKIAYAPMGGKAPTKFEAPSGSMHFFFTLKKAAK